MARSRTITGMMRGLVALAALGASDAAAQGAPIVFASRTEPNRPAATPALSTQPPRTVAVSTPSLPEGLYGYGRRALRAAPAIDLRRAPRPHIVPASLSTTDLLEPAPSPAVPLPTPAAERVQAVPAAVEVGLASWYGPGFNGRRTASGEAFDENALTAAHPSLPLPSLAHVTNLENGREVVVRVNDRGPFTGGRVMDLSRRAAETLDLVRQGSARVEIRYLGPASGPPAAPAPSPPPAPTRSEGPGRYVVQVGAFGSAANAERARARLAAAGSAFVDVAPTGSGAVLHRVRLGGWSTPDEAEVARGQAAALGFLTAVVIAP